MNPLRRPVLAALLASLLVAGPAGAAPRPHPLKVGKSAGPAGYLTASWLKNRRTSLTVAYSTSAQIIGRLRTRRGGPPIAGQKVEIYTRPFGSKVPKGITAVTSRLGGFRVRVPGRTRPQTVNVVARPAAGAPALSVRLKLRIRARVRLNTSASRVRASRGVRFSGRVFAPAIPRRGVLVEMQVRVPGSRSWRTFRTTRTTQAGRFRTRQRFKRTPGGTLYSFRARYRSQGRVPTQNGYSRTLRVRIR